MTLIGRLALLFVLIPVLELMLLIRLGSVVGVLPTLGLVVLTGVTGAALARAEGLRVFFQFQRELASGRLPGQALLDGISVLVGGAFLLTPGILTDVAGFALLLPPSRRWIQRRVRRNLESRIQDGSIRVMTMGSGQWWAGYQGADGRTTDPAADSNASPYRGLDPTKGIVVDGGSGKPDGDA